MDSNGVGAIQQHKNRCFRAAVWRGLGWELLASVPVDDWKKGKWAGVQGDGETPMIACACVLCMFLNLCVCKQDFSFFVPVWTYVFCRDTVFCSSGSSVGAGAGVVVQRWKTSASCDHSPSWSVKVLADACKPLKCWSSKCSCLLSQPGGGGLSGHKLKPEGRWPRERLRGFGL